MKFNKYFMLGLAGLAFAACSNDENLASDSNEKGKMYVSLSMGSAQTRSLGNGAVNQYNTIERLKFLFYDAAGNYVYYPVDEQVRTKAVNDLASNAHRAEVVLTNVPSVVQTLVIVANEVSSNPIGTGTLEEAEKTDIYLVNQASTKFTNFSNEKSTLTGKGSVEESGGSYSVQMTLKPVTARLEVGQFTAVPAPDTYMGETLTKFNVTGIYINRFYYQGALAAALDNNRKRVDNGQGADPDDDGIDDKPEHAYTKTNYAAYNADGITGNFAFLCDEPKYGDAGDADAVSVAGGAAETVQVPTLTIGETTSITYTEKSVKHKVTPKTAGKWWGYTAFRGDVPQIIVKLDVWYGNSTTPIEKYLTIDSYTRKTAVDNSFALTSLERGYVYRIDNVIFNEENLTNNPNQSTITVNAIVDIMAWTEVPVFPNFK